MIKADFLQSCNRLKILDLSNNYIETIDDNAFGSLKKLKVLNLNSNRLKQVTNKWSIRNLPNLTHLKMNQNNISKIDPLSFENMISLKTLDLNSNQLSLENVNNGAFVIHPDNPLRQLNLSNNSLTTVTIGQMFGMNSLTWLDLSHNPIDYFTSNLWNQMKSLRTLIVSHTNLMLIKENTFRDLSMLRKLYIESANVEVIFDDAFVTLKNLRKLFLSNNRLRQMSKEVFEPMKNLQKFIMESKEMKCECFLQWIFTWRQQGSISRFNQTKVKCLNRNGDYVDLFTLKLEQQCDKIDSKPFIKPNYDKKWSLNGSYYKMECSYSTNIEDKSIKIIWLKDGNELNFKFDSRRVPFAITHRKNSLWQYKSLLQFRSITEADKGDYQCRVSFSNGHFIDSEKRQMKIYVSPKFIRPIVTHLLSTINKEVVISCEASGVPEPKISLKKTGTADAFISRRIVIDQKFPGLFLLKSLKRSDSGDYQCIASNDAGMNTYQFTLHVNNPIFKAELTKRVGESNITLECQLNQKQWKKIIWQKNGYPIKEDVENITFKTLNLEDNGNYTCYVHVIDDTVVETNIILNVQIYEPFNQLKFWIIAITCGLVLIFGFATFIIGTRCVYKKNRNDTFDEVDSSYISTKDNNMYYISYSSSDDEQQ
ncbi:hypothetical protein RDWZM_007590 [Blomia tropicalis]|uniref:Ig-like domain-containing protein n=1 Tax=Blomia tropicalis TaxID=40697 RepID=A0A9Q0M0H6_BLOTA|nr:hypothetical protein RDWZM_007590 [Blomia tropicalis]